jgi:putative transposase/transposase-like zinc-binding protein
VLEIADIVRAAGPELCARLAVLPSQKRALQAIQQCRTAALGGQVYGCMDCGKLQYSYHSCGNRHCPKCHGQQTERWLEKQRGRLLPCPYFLLTFTLPSELRALARSHQKLFYGLLLNAAAASIQKLCADPKWLGAQPALMGVLHTWTRAMLYHPHAHFLVSAGGWSADGQRWVSAKHPNFLMPVRALSVIFRARVRDRLMRAGLFQQIPAKVWKQKWVVHAQHAGSGQKVLDYLGRYVFRIAISNSRLQTLEDGQVTFRYRDNRTQQLKGVRLPVQQFLQRFLQHVLPMGLTKVRHYGLSSSACRQRHAAAMALLQTTSPPTPPDTAPAPANLNSRPHPEPIARCPHCGTGRLVYFGQVLPARKIPP